MPNDEDSQLQKYNRDPREVCRYGDKCYQKNATHHEKFKHPPKTNKRKKKFTNRFAKIVKIDENQVDKGNPPVASDKKESISSSESEQENINVAEVTKQDTNSEVKKDELEETLEDDDAGDLDHRSFIKQKFLLEFPNDFYQFWDFCKEQNPKQPLEALSNVGLKLVGVYDVLGDNFKNVKWKPDAYLRHWRYYYDTPELQTVIKGGDNTGYHIGYFFDSPTEPPAFLISNEAQKNGVFSKMGPNIFAAVNLYLQEFLKSCDPFKKMQVTKLSHLIKDKAQQLNLSLSTTSKEIQDREKKVVTKTFNKVGLVVPYNKKTELGYRDLAMDDKALVVLLNKLEKASPEAKPRYLSDLQPVLTYANIALDECDFGTGVKLGWELLFHGISDLNSTISRFLSNSYRLLNREEFGKIAEAHMSDRKKGCNLSIL